MKTKIEHLIQIPVRLTKAQLAEARGLYESVNATAFRGHDRERLRLKTFAGRYDLRAGVFVGAYLLDPYPVARDDDARFTTLPGLHEQAPTKRRVASAPTVEEAPDHG